MSKNITSGTHSKIFKNTFISQQHEAKGGMLDDVDNTLPQLIMCSCLYSRDLMKNV